MGPESTPELAARLALATKWSGRGGPAANVFARSVAAIGSAADFED
jgi:hypothetical protein